MAGGTLLLGVLAACAVGALVRAGRTARRLRGQLASALRALEHLERSVTPATPEPVLERLLGGPGPAAGERKEVTILFTDLHAFTALSEKLPPDRLVDVLNGYLGRMTQVLLAHRGHVAAFLGDGILALFGALEPNPWQAQDAAHAALAMRRALERYNEELMAPGAPPLRAGIGIHCGSAVVGLVGSRERLTFTAIGPTVNVAARVEGLTRHYGADILVTDRLRERLDAHFVLRAMGASKVAGICEPVTTYALLEAAADP